MNQASLKKILTKHWNLHITSLTDVPRQFVAKTFFVKTENKTYFCKIIDKPLFIDGVVNSLPALVSIHGLGYTRINYPIPTANNDLFIKEDGTLIVLFNFIDAPQNYDYDNAILGKTIAEIHKLSPQITTPIKHEQFEFKHAGIFMKKLDQLSSEAGQDEIATDLHKLIKANYSTIVSAYKQFQIVVENCSNAELDIVVTHGDAPGNVLVKSPDDIYIIDWDDILLAPAERDLWFMIDKQDFMDGYTREIPEYKPNQVALDYYLLSRYFNDMVEYWAEILGDFNEEHKKSNLRQLNKELFSEDGWLHPMIEEFLNRSK